MTNATVIGRASAADVLDPARLESLAGELDVAGDALRVLAGRAQLDNSRAAFLTRAVRCYGAASLLRKIAE